MNDTLYNAVTKLAKQKPLRFNMPGHKGKDILGIGNTADIDFTETYGLDNLHWPIGCIAESERLMAELCGASRSFFIVNGSSAGVIAAVLALTSDNDTIVCARNSHVSLFKGLCLSGARPLYFMPEIIDEYGICGGVTPKAVRQALESAKGAAAVYLTSPTFEGVGSDIGQIADITHKFGAKLIVDEAHGAHFKFGGDFPETAIRSGADIAVQSWHKTLTSYGQGAVMHAGRETDVSKLGFCLSVMQSTSPSYPIMVSIDKTRALLAERGETIFKVFESNLKYLRENLSKLNNIRLISDEIKGKNGVYGFDNSKITLFLKGEGRTLDNFLRSRGMLAEMSGCDYVVLMTSFADDIADYEALIKAVREFDSRYAGKAASHFSFEYRIPEMALTPRESMGRRGKKELIHDASGKISGGFITPYPPAIPITAPGEIISEECAEYCATACGHLDINGVIDGRYLRILE